jgi:LCP family protein required for cell wall assembly
MKKDTQNIDGFIPRRPGQQLGDRHQPASQRPSAQTRQELHSGQNFNAAPVASRRSVGISRSEIDDSLRTIDQTTALDKAGRKARRGLGHLPDKARRRKIIKWVLVAVVVLAISAGAYIGVRAWLASNNIFKGNIFDILQNQPLKADENGRTNILLLGTSEDDPGHGGAYLTDSMMVLSLDQKNKNAYMFSIPRDLYVKYGQNCNSGSAGKINEFFNCVNDDYTSPAAEQERLTTTQAFIGDIVGLNIQYGVHVNNTVIKQAVDAVGGVDVDIQGNGPVPYGVKPGSVLDRNFDWRCKYQCYLVKYDPGVHHIDGEHALFLAMARGDSEPTYGLASSNFDREKNQQKIIAALKDKAVSTGTFSNLAKVTGLIDALGANLRTNFETKEIRTLMQLGTDIPTSNIKSISLYDGDKAVVGSDNVRGMSVVVPNAGTFDYSELQAFIQKSITNNPVSQEAASVVIYNGSGVPGAAQQEADKLTKQGFTITDVQNAPEGSYSTYEVYQFGGGMTATAAKLQSLYGTTLKTSGSPVQPAAGTNFVVIIGQSSSVNAQ